MKETFAKNAEELSEGIREENTYTWKILSVKDIKEGLDEVVKNLDMNQTLYALMIDLFDNCKKWINQDENEISKLISDFILGQFRPGYQEDHDGLSEREIRCGQCNLSWSRKLRMRLSRRNCGINPHRCSGRIPCTTIR
ncbi:MAG: hypothetical protein ACLTAX_11530 [Waltera sp.]